MPAGETGHLLAKSSDTTGAAPPLPMKYGAPSPAVLVDNTAGTANSTLEALADGTTYATDVAAIRNNFADLAAKINALIAALKAAGVLS